MTKVAIVDHGAGNLVSIAQGLERAGARPALATSAGDLEGVDGIVLPGVGATATVMEGIRRRGLLAPLRTTSLPLLGICVGMQVLFEGSDEDGAEGLGLLAGTVRRLAEAPRLPHIGWNDVTILRPDPLFAGLPTAPVFYFVHSYAPEPTAATTVVATAEYGTPFVAAVRSGHVAGVQFHPERSDTNGLTVLSNFVAGCRVAAGAAR